MCNVKKFILKWNEGKNNVEETEVLAFCPGEDMADYMDQRPNDDVASRGGNSEVFCAPTLY